MSLHTVVWDAFSASVGKALRKFETLLIPLTDIQSEAVLGALRRVATARGTLELTDADRRALDAFEEIVLRRGAPLDVDALPDTTPARLASVLRDAGTRENVVQFLVVMALVDGVVDKGRIAIVEEYAKRLGVQEDAVCQLAELGRGNLAWVRADAQRQNLSSITGHELTLPLDEWILPYRDDHADQDLADRYRALGALPAGSLGRTFFEFYRVNGFAFPGEPNGVNERFATPHDTTHVLSGYSISPQGELLVSTFTAGMHPREPMSGHILPVIISWHLGIELVRFAGSTTGQLDAAKFWNAWERGAEVTTDVFSGSWDFWAVAPRPIDALRAAYRVPPLEQAYAADDHMPAWYHPVS
ncbi:MAG: hypothetical protein ABWY12_11430 [Burkholderiales bacterium]